MLEQTEEQNERYYDYMLRMSREEDRKVYMENTVERSIWVTFRKEGIHLYPAAKDDPALATGDWDDVSFLGVAHRHIFHFKVRIQVEHNDRDIEFIQFKRWLERLYDDSVIELNHKSCEMIADDLYEQISAKYPGRFVEIDVAEDGENGCSIFYPRHS
jgi:hypothetical protein|tara:strand:- start:372 stop:845 length:474 start_codon:yes stop_codon:yes gene_type:complete